MSSGMGNQVLDLAQIKCVPSILRFLIYLDASMTLIYAKWLV